jgi:putative redox protein
MKGNSRRVIVSEIKRATDALKDGYLLQSSNTSSLVCNIQIGKHSMISDVKAVERGGDLGPSPKELCYSALGACTVMTIRTFYENTKATNGSSWASSNLVNISILLDEISGNHAHVPEGVDMMIELDGNLTDEQRKRLLRAADNCPVKKMMGGGLQMNTSLMENF